MEHTAQKNGFNIKQLIIWTVALLLGAGLGYLKIDWLDTSFSFIASVYTRLFQFVAVPTIALAIMTTLATMGSGRESGKIFRCTIVYTLLTTVAAAVTGVILYKLIAPGNLPLDIISGRAGGCC